MLLELVCGLWIAAGAYVFWYVVKAEDYQPMALDDLALTWRLHKHQNKCKFSYIQDLLVRKDEVVGFKCGCGYEFLQRRLITQKTKTIAQPVKLVPSQDMGGALKNLGVAYLNIENV